MFLQNCCFNVLKSLPDLLLKLKCTTWLKRAISEEKPLIFLLPMPDGIWILYGLVFNSIFDIHSTTKSIRCVWEPTIPVVIVSVLTRHALMLWVITNKNYAKNITCSMFRLIFLVFYRKYVSFGYSRKKSRNAINKLTKK